MRCSVTSSQLQRKKKTVVFVVICEWVKAA
jgi:hypothetical protein